MMTTGEESGELDPLLGTEGKNSIPPRELVAFLKGPNQPWTMTNERGKDAGSRENDRRPSKASEKRGGCRIERS